MMMSDERWEARLAQTWAAFDSSESAAFVERVRALAAERPEGDPVAAFELASAYDSTGSTELAVPLYRAALSGELPPNRRRRATIQLASSLRVLGRADESVALLRGERERTSDELDDAVAAFLAPALADRHDERAALGTALAALARHLPRYAASLARYASALDAPVTTPRSTREVIVQSARFGDATAFYRGVLGFEVALDEEALVGFETGSIRLYVEPGELAGPVFELVCDDPAALARHILASGGAIVEDDPELPRLYVRDPFGITFNLRAREGG